MAESCTAAGVQDPYYQRLDEVISSHQGKPGALIAVLHQAQLIFGYLPDEALIKIAEGLGVPLSEVYGVVTFYSFFSTTPKGQHSIGVCMGTACYVKGAAAVLEKIQEELGIKMGETSADGLFTLTVTRCVGACGLAPVMTIGEDVYGRLTPDRIPEILDRYRKKDKVGNAS